MSDEARIRAAAVPTPECLQLCDVCTLINGRAYKKDEMLRAGKYLLLRVGNFFSNRDWIILTWSLKRTSIATRATFSMPGQLLLVRESGKGIR